MPLNRPKDRKGKYFTFMVIPHDSEKNIVKFRSPSWMVFSSFFIIFLSGVIFTSSIVYTANLTKRLVHYRAMLEINNEQAKQIDYFSSESNKLKGAIEELLASDNDVRKLLGLGTKKLKTDISSVVITKERERLSKAEELSEKMKGVKENLASYNDELSERKQSLEELRRSVSDIMARYYHTPSTWPVYGRIVSGFGYRYSPWRGFHTGIDITCWYGSPIRATAAGVVTNAGWLGGYGYAVKIDHGYGVETLYGHNSRFEVSYGSRVRKGQIIAYAGSTGFSTGPHCHYEVRKSGNPINPWGYLNLDVFTASRIWHGAR